MLVVDTSAFVSLALGDVLDLVTAEFEVVTTETVREELRAAVESRVALSPIVLRAAVQRGALGEAEARAAFETISEGRDWLEAPIHRYARELFE